MVNVSKSNNMCSNAEARSRQRPRFAPVTVATNASLPGENFYVDACDLKGMGEQLLLKKLMMLLGARQSGKSTDAMALMRELERDGFKVDTHLWLAS